MKMSSRAPNNPISSHSNKFACKMAIFCFYPIKAGSGKLLKKGKDVELKE